MLEIIEIKSAAKNYKVHIGEGNYKSSTENVSIIDKNLIPLWEKVKSNNMIIFSATEEHKTLFEISALIEKMRELKMNRVSHLVAVGGGVTQDVATFTASSYMRGISWTLVPTTLLSMVDSCIGGKSSINVGKYKNISGNFFPPENIIIDTEFCQTLTKQQIIEGLCEAVKICYAHSDEKFREYLLLADKKTHKELDYKKIVSLTLNTKKEFIEIDEFDNGVRLLLNFGHTFGHAIESASGYRIPHGIAVGLGMICARFASEYFVENFSVNSYVEKLIEYTSSILNQVPSLAEMLNSIDIELAMAAFESDKKHSDSEYILILYNEDSGLTRKKIAKSVNSKINVYDSFYKMKRFFE